MSGLTWAHGLWVAIMPGIANMGCVFLGVSGVRSPGLTLGFRQKHAENASLKALEG